MRSMQWVCLQGDGGNVCPLGNGVVGRSPMWAAFGSLERVHWDSPLIELPVHTNLTISSAAFCSLVGAMGGNGDA